jgi:uncharacterized protein YbbK (DUF523 family)
VLSRRAEARAGGGEVRIGVSACLLGEPVRYDGGDRRDPRLQEALGELVAWVPVCPEVECGLGVPREAMRLTGDPAAPRLVTVDGGVDHTARLQDWIAVRLEELARAGLRGFVFKSRSPSCGIACGGLFARAYAERFPGSPVIEDAQLHEPERGRAFRDRVLGTGRRRA